MNKFNMPNYTIVELTTGADVGEPVTVEITVPTDSVDILNIPLLPTLTKDMGARMTMSKEGP